MYSILSDCTPTVTRVNLHTPSYTVNVCVIDSGYEPKWYVNDLCGLLADYCLTWREPLLTYQFYDIIAAIIGTSVSCVTLHYNCRSVIITRCHTYSWLFGMQCVP